MADQQKLISVNLSSEAISHLAWLCDERVHWIRKFISEKLDDSDEQDEISDMRDRMAYYEDLARQLRSARDGK